MMARDFSWLFVAALGAVAFHFALGFPFGTVNEVGAAVYPLILAVILIGISVYAFLFSPREFVVTKNWRAFACVTAAVAAFILLVEVAGLIPATVISMVIAYAGQTEGRYGAFLLYAGLFAGGVWLLFAHALGLPIPAFGIP